MKCPRCAVPLEWRPAKDTGLNSCPTCQGLWLDYDALSKARQNHEAALADDFSTLPGTKISTISCPSDGARLLTISHLGVEVDTCPDCKGLWLDKGEWDKLAEAHRSSAVPMAGIAAAAVGGVALAGGAAALAGQPNQSSSSFLTKVRGTSNQGDVVCDFVESTAGDLIEGTFSMIGSICSSIFD